MSDQIANPAQDPELAAYYSVLAEAATQGNRLAEEPSEHEVAELLRRRGTLPTPAAIEAWYQAEDLGRRARTHL